MSLGGEHGLNEGKAEIAFHIACRSSSLPLLQFGAQM